jgi:flagellar capping protein FliD
MQARLAIRRAALQQEFTAADQAMARLNSQKSTLSSFSANLSGTSL